jgi:hypothetical protein
MPLFGRGMLLTFTDVAPADEREFNEWYNREHIDERVNLPGFFRARRYLGEDADPRYFAIYECAGVADLVDPGYLRLLANQTPWSQKVIARFTRFERMTLAIRADRTHGIGGAVTCLRLAPAPEAALTLLAWLEAEGLAEAVRLPGMLGAFAGENDLEAANAPAKAQGLRYPESAVPEWAIVLEGADTGATAAAAAAVFPPSRLRGLGIEAPPRTGSYRLLFASQR